MNTINVKALSVNSCYQGRRFKNNNHKVYVQNVLSQLPKEYKVNEAPYKLILQFGLSSKLQDLDNCIKVFQDCLVKMYNFDDRDIYKLEAEKVIVKKGCEFIKFEIVSLK